MSNTTRIAIYGIMTAVLAFLSTQGWVTAQEQAAYAEAGAESLLALGALMAAVKTFKQRGKEVVMSVRMDGTNAEKAEAFAEALKQLRGRPLV